MGTIPLHGISNNGSGQGLGAAWLANQEQRNAQLNADNHHEDVLLQGLVAGNVRLQLHAVKEHILTPETPGLLVKHQNVRNARV